MDLTRFFLYTALAVITYLMLLAWQEDYPPGVDTAVPAQESSTMQQTDLPEVADLNQPAIADTSTDLPTEVPIAEPQTTTISQPTEIVSSGSQTINVTTDTFELEIDLNGGDITFLALPQYLKQLDVPDDPFVILQNIPGRSYVSQSGLIGQDGVDSGGRALYQSNRSNYFMEEGQDVLHVDLETSSDNGVSVTKRFSFVRGSYLIDISFLVENPTDSTWQANAFGQIKRDSFDDPSDAGGFGRTYLGFVVNTNDDPYIEIDFDDIDENVRDNARSTFDREGGWIGFSQHYFISAWIPTSDSLNRLSTRRNNAGQYFGEFTGSALVVPPQSSNSYSMQFYAGPKDQYRLAEIAPNLDLTIDYSFLWFLAAPIYWLLTRIESFVGNYGISIILLTVVVKAALYKLSETQYRSMAGMRRLMPKMQQLKESYGDDKMKLQQATMELYRKEKLNPFGGCLPMLVQMPIFIALYWVLMEAVELRHAPFMLWLNDLSVRDPFFILPILMGVTMYLQTKLSPAPPDPMQAKVMQLMPFVMTILFLWFPAGLVLYWLTNGALGIAQQWYITRKIDAEYEAKKANP